MKKIKLLLSLAVILIGCSAIGVFGQTTVVLQPYLTGLSSPLLLTNAKDGTDRNFVVQQRGIIKVVQPGSTTATDFINLSSKVSSSGSERGLLGLAFHPNFETNSYFFVNYTRQSDGATIIARYTATNNNTVGDINSERIIMTIPQPFSNHNGGMIEFGPDGYLYIGMGDGGSGNDPGNRAQNINELLGKMLRIDPSLAENPPTPAYTNPPDNPYVGVAGADEIYATGLRNPFRWSFDRGGSNQLWAGDVGQNAIEEVDIITLGGNYGWRVFEGNTCTNLDPTLCIPANFIAPVTTYDHSGGRCSITGGYVYRGTQGTFPLGTYLFGDFCSGDVYTWNGTQATHLFDSLRSISSFGEDENGEIYLVGLSNGTVDKFVNNSPVFNDANADFDGDGKTDVSVFRPSTGVWYALNSSNGQAQITQFGATGDIPASKDYDGDGTTDIGIFRPSTGVWYYFRSSDSTVGIAQFGASGDIPAAGDYDGDGVTDLAVFRPSTGVWYIFQSSNNQAQITLFGLDGDIPTAGDYDGDGRYDIAVFRPSDGFWYRLNSGSGSSTIQFGAEGDIPTTGDYDGDGKNDQAVFRPSTGVWYWLKSGDGSVGITQFGANGDIPAAGDYDRDGRSDLAVFRPSSGVWYVLQSFDSSVNIAQFGLDGDLPAPAYDAR